MEGGIVNKSESKYYNTARLMDTALLELLDKNDFEYITVKQICLKAGVNRSTFYLHYESTADLLEEAIENLFDDLKKYYSQDGAIDLKSESLDDLLFFKRKFSIPYLKFIKDNKKAFMAALNKPIVFKVERMFEKMYREIYSPVMDKFNVEEKEKRYIIQFYLNGIHALIAEWIRGDCADDIEFVADLIAKCITYK